MHSNVYERFILNEDGSSIKVVSLCWVNSDKKMERRRMLLLIMQMLRSSGWIPSLENKKKSSRCENFKTSFNYKRIVKFNLFLIFNFIPFIN